MVDAWTQTDNSDFAVIKEKMRLKKEQLQKQAIEVQQPLTGGFKPSPGSANFMQANPNRSQGRSSGITNTPNMRGGVKAPFFSPKQKEGTVKNAQSMHASAEGSKRRSMKGSSGVRKYQRHSQQRKEVIPLVNREPQMRNNIYLPSIGEQRKASKQATPSKKPLQESTSVRAHQDHQILASRSAIKLQNQITNPNPSKIGFSRFSRQPKAANPNAESAFQYASQDETNQNYSSLNMQEAAKVRNTKKGARRVVSSNDRTKIKIRNGPK